MNVTPPTAEQDQLGGIARTSRILALAVAIIGGALVVYAGSLPFAGLDGTVFMGLVVFVAALTWGLSVILTALAGHPSRSLLIAPAIGVAAVALVVSGLPVAVRVAISDQALSTTVDRILAGTLQLTEYDEEPIIWAGAIPIYGVWRGDDYLVTGFTGSDTPAGLVRLPSGPPEGRVSTDERILHHVYGPWYAWSYF